MLVQNLPCICFGSCLGDSETTRVWQTLKNVPKGGAIVFDFEKPKLKLLRFPKTKDMANLWLNRWKEAMVPH